MTHSIVIAYDVSARCIARGPVDCCFLCGKADIDLPVDHGCSPNLPADALAVVLHRASGEVKRAPSIYDLWDRKLNRPTGHDVGAAHQPPALKGTPKARLAGVLRTLHNAPVGQRNGILYWCACRAREMLVAGELADQASIINVLSTVALAIGLDQREVAATIRSAFNSAEVVT